MNNCRRIQDAPLSLDALLADTERDDCGALAIFAGTVRNHHEGKPVTHLVYTAHAALADKMIRGIEQEVAGTHGVPVCHVVHRIGALDIGESAILAVVRAPHRAEAFAALRAVVDAVKHRVPIWKEEFYADGSSAFVTGCCIAEDAGDHQRHHEHGQQHA
jgi:molybdopterin synthase catalytic subunit